MNNYTISEKRLKKFKRVAAFRQNMTVVLENVHDPHNIGAVMRTCDSVGIQELYIIYSDPRLKEEKLEKLKNSSTGVKKWLDVKIYDNVLECMSIVKQKYSKLLATHLNEASVSLYEEDLTENIAFLLGNEHEGLTEELLEYADYNINIPQYGMVDSLNISVACAVMLHEASRQRASEGMYVIADTLTPSHESIYQQFLDIHNRRYDRS